MPAPTLTEIAAAAARARGVLEARTRGTYAPGTALGDLVVDAHAILYADLMGMIRGLDARRSLLALRDAPQTQETRDATDALLGNLFVTRGAGTFARASGTVYLSRRADTLLPRTTRFFAGPARVFYPDLAEDRLVPATALRPSFNTSGEVESWCFDVNLVAARTGAAYRVAAGNFTAVDPFSPYLLYAAHGDAAGGDDPDTNAQAVARVDTALSLRALLNARSNDATLRNRFAEVLRVRTVGMGDPEMVRDLLDARTFGVEVHRGGHVDIYTDLPSVRTTVRLVVGEPTPRADGLVATLVDPTTSFVAAGVRAGQVLHVAAGLPDAPRDYKVAAVRENEIDVVASAPFVVATDELDAPADVLYSVGDNYPVYDNAVGSALRPARTSRAMRVPGHVTLPPGPVGAVVRVEVPSPPLALAAYSDPVLGGVAYAVRRNGELARAPLPGEPLTFRVVGWNPREAQSMRAVTTVDLAWPGLDLDGTEVLVTYETSLAFAAVDAVVRSETERHPGANHLARAPHPVYVSFTAPYRQRTVGSSAADVVRPVDTARVVDALVRVVESSPAEGLDVGRFIHAASLADRNIGALYPFEVRYELLLPDGRVARYRTRDRVTLYPTAADTAELLNPEELGLAPGDAAGLARLLRGAGLSNRVVRFFSDSSLVALEARS